MACSCDTKNPKRSVYYFVKRYIQEFLEAFIGLIIIYIFTQKEINYQSLLKTSGLLGFITLILEDYNPNFNSNIKQGMSFTVGANLMNL